VSLREKFFFRIIKIVLRGDFYTAESTLSFSAIAHGIVLIGNISNPAVIFSSPIQPSGLFAAYIVGLLLLGGGIAEVLSSRGSTPYSRCIFLMTQFIGWLALAVAVVINPFSHVLVNIAYVTIVVLAAGLYLSAAAGDGE
jgi:uncharacterized membrane protein HdeD (DUF308 family)